MRRRRYPSTRGVSIFATPILVLVAFFLLRSGYRAAFAGNDPASKAVRDQIEASKRMDCAKVFNLYSARTQQLMLEGQMPRQPVSRELVIKWNCSFAEEADLGDYLPDKIRRIEGNDREALVGATYKYDRFFGFFGEGKQEARFLVLKEANAWKIDHTESIDPNSRTNLNQRAMFLLQQLYTAEHQMFTASGAFSTEFARIQQQLPGYPFPPIRTGIADRNAPVGTLYVQPGPRKDLVCMSTKSGTGTLVMIKEDEGNPKRKISYQYGTNIPRLCDTKALARPYHGTSSGIE